MVFRAECMRGVAIRLSLALMAGLLIVTGYVVVPVLFAKAASSAEAGMLAGHIFHIANRGVLLLGIAVAVFWLRMGEIGKMRWSILLVLLALVAINEFALTPVMAEIKSQAGPMDMLAKDHPQRAVFGMWHGISATGHLLASLCAAALVMLGGGRKISCSHS
ncbi:MAG: DUF4149 domain-containing protein [Mariprofundaceae bacterium]